MGSTHTEQSSQGFCRDDDTKDGLPMPPDAAAEPFVDGRSMKTLCNGLSDECSLHTVIAYELLRLLLAPAVVTKRCTPIQWTDRRPRSVGDDIVYISCSSSVPRIEEEPSLEPPLILYKRMEGSIEVVADRLATST